ncbi:Sec20 domain [Lecanosticta acicola]|uniref:Sec20 domain n=1 Tax=Lecanosticta acicola TaxID=111012 RepID=A0AAI8Z1R6_9PEZI|nr:Sec20 domain [Lecanosticta acicola]
MTATDLANQLSALSDSLKTTNTLISRLGKLQLQPGSEPLEGQGGVRLELAQDIHDSLKQLEEELEFLRQEAEDYRIDGGQKRRASVKYNEEARVGAKVARLGEELIHSRQQFRNAQIAAKFASDEAKRKEREAILEGYRKEAEHIEAANGSLGSERDQLFAGRGRRNQQQTQLTKDEILVNASSDVTAALRRTHDLLSTELSRSRFAQETFDESTAALAQLGEDYSNLDTILKNSRNLLGTLLQSQKSDTWYLETAFYILITTLVWLIFRRLLFGPFIKLPLFLVNVLTFLLNWAIWKPFFFFLSITGIITSEPVSTSLRATQSSISTSRAPLIVQPSAKGRPSNPLPDGGSHPGIPAGAGGAGAKQGVSPELEGKLTEKIGKMAEESSRQAEGAQQNADEQKVLPKRGDGTVLQERGAEPPNPKKKSFEADVEDAKHQAEQQLQQEKERRKRDEL